MNTTNKLLTAKEAIFYLNEWGISLSKSALYMMKNLRVSSGHSVMFSKDSLDAYISIRKELISTYKASKIIGIKDVTLKRYALTKGAPHEEHFGRLYFEEQEIKMWYDKYRRKFNNR